MPLLTRVAGVFFWWVSGGLRREARLSLKSGFSKVECPECLKEWFLNCPETEVWGEGHDPPDRVTEADPNLSLAKQPHC